MLLLIIHFKIYALHNTILLVACDRAHSFPIIREYKLNRRLRSRSIHALTIGMTNDDSVKTYYWRHFCLSETVKDMSSNSFVLSFYNLQVFHHLRLASLECIQDTNCWSFQWRKRNFLQWRTGKENELHVCIFRSLLHSNLEKVTIVNLSLYFLPRCFYFDYVYTVSTNRLFSSSSKLYYTNYTWKH